MFCFEWRVRLQAPTGAILSTNNKCQKKEVRIKSWITFLSKFFQRFHITKSGSQTGKENILFHENQYGLYQKLSYFTSLVCNTVHRLPPSQQCQLPTNLVFILHSGGPELGAMLLFMFNAHIKGTFIFWGVL